MLARAVSAEQEEEERRQLQRSWEMAAVLDFLDLFREELKFDRAFTACELESVLILSPGGEGLLGAVHTVGPSIPVVALFSPSRPCLFLQHMCRACCSAEFLMCTLWAFVYNCSVVKTPRIAIGHSAMG